MVSGIPTPLSPAEVAEHLRVSTATVYRLITRGELSHISSLLAAHARTSRSPRAAAGETSFRVG